MNRAALAVVAAVLIGWTTKPGQALAVVVLVLAVAVGVGVALAAHRHGLARLQRAARR